MRVAPHKPGAVHYICYPAEHRFEQDVVLFRVILQVGILDDNVVPRRFGNPSVQCSAFAFVHFMPVVLDVQPRVAFPVGLNGLLRSVCGTVIHDDHLFAKPAIQFDCFHFIEDKVDGAGFIVSRDNNGKVVLHAPICFKPVCRKAQR